MQPELFQAATAGDATRVQVALASGADPNTRSTFRWTALHTAAAKGNAAIVDLLMAAGADVNATCPYTMNVDRELYDGTHTALLLALRNDHEDVAVQLLDRGADPDAEDALDRARPIHEAAKRGFARAVDRLIGRGADLGAREGYQAKSALVEAVQAGHAAVALRLLGAGAPAEPRALYEAAYRNLPDVAARLLEAGIHVDAEAADANALYAAAWAGHAAMIEWLLARGASLAPVGAKALFAAANAGRTEAVRVLVARGVPVDAVDEHGWTALLAAAWQGHADTVALLLASGADLAHRERTGKTALTWAREGKRADVIALLEAAERGGRSQGGRP